MQLRASTATMAAVFGTLLDEYIAKDRGIYAVYPHRRYLPAKVRSFVDYLAVWFRRHQR